MAEERGVHNEVSGIVFGNVVQARDVADLFALEVHPAIDARPDVALLPSYVERDHDVRLREVVSRAVDGASGIVVLVGGSSTGKTSACWEALRFVPDDWRLWRGDIDGLQARIEIGDAMAGHHLVEVLNRQNRHDEANRLRRFGLKPNGTIASGS